MRYDSGHDIVIVTWDHCILFTVDKNASFCGS